MTKRAILGAVLLVSCLMSHVAAQAAHVERHEGLPIIYLSGTPYELGRQHGKLLREDVRGAVRQLLGYFRSYLKVPLVRAWAVNWWLDRAWHAALPFVSADVREELRGLADGAGVPLRELYRLHAIPDRTYSCASFAAWGRATAGGLLIHMRNLDWNIDADIQRYATVFVIRPTGKRAFISMGWAGFVGVLTGVNDAQISVGQIGAETTDVAFRGEPMAFVMRRVLEESASLGDASRLVLTARRTVGVNYVFADAKAKRGIVIETTHRHIRTFTADDAAEREVAYARPMRDAVYRADTAVDPIIRERQVASHGDPSRPGLEDPMGSSAYDVRYVGQAAGLQASFGELDAAKAQAIARAVAPNSNIQSVVFAWPDLWVANAQGRIPAAQTSYHRLDARRLLTSGKD